MVKKVKIALAVLAVAVSAVLYFNTNQVFGAPSATNSLNIFAYNWNSISKLWEKNTNAVVGGPSTTNGQNANLYAWSTTQNKWVAMSASSTGGGGITSPLTTKGDIWVYGSADTRLPVGANGLFLSSSSTSPTGLAWATASSSGVASVGPWGATTTGSIWYNSGNVGIGSTTPHYKLTVNGSTYATGSVFAIQPAQSYQNGLLYYESSNSDGDGLAFYNSDANVKMNIGRELWKHVRNCNTGSTILEGTAVRISGATGQIPCVVVATADGKASSSVIGIATQDITNNSNGEVTTYGIVNGLNTSVFTDGAILYLATSTVGKYRNLTDIQPVSPYFSVIVGDVDYSHNSLGKIELRIFPGHVLSDNADIQITNPLQGQVLIYDSSIPAWRNFATSSLGISGTGVSAHNLLSNLNWSSAAHTFDTNLDVDGYGFISSGTSTFATAASGKVGIGTTTPSSKLTVVGDIFLTSAFKDSINSAGTSGMVLQTDGASTHWVATSSLGISGSGGTPGGADTNIQFNNGGAFAGSSTLVWDNINGRLGVNKASPSYTLDVEGNLNLKNNFIIYGGGNKVIKSETTSFSAGMGSGNVGSDSAGIDNTSVGVNANYGVIGNDNTSIGYNAGYNLYDGTENIIIGSGAGYSLQSNYYNTIIGKSACAIGKIDSSVCIGYNAGYRENASNKLYINNRTTNNLALDRLTSMIYGEFSTATTTQNLFLNANTTITGTTTLNGLAYKWPTTQAAGNLLQVDGNGQLSWVATSSLGIAGAANHALLSNLDYASSAHTGFEPTITTLTLSRGGIGFDASAIALGGLLTGSGAGTMNILTVGANGRVLMASSTAPSGIDWVATSSLGIISGGSSPLTTKGDIFVYSTTNDRLPIGTPGQMLSASSTSATGLAWITTGASAVINSGLAGQVAYYNADGTALSGTSTISISTTTGALTLGGGAESMRITSDGRIGIGTSTPQDTLSVIQSGGYSMFGVYASTSLPMLKVNQNGFVGINIEPSEDVLAVRSIGGSDIFDTYDSTGNSVFKILNNGFVRLEPLKGLFWASSDKVATSTDYLGFQVGTSTIFAVFPAPVNMSSSTNMKVDMYEPPVLSCTGVANFYAVYSDDVNRILTFGTAAGAAVTLHDSTLSSAATGGLPVYAGPSGTTLQTITTNTMYSSTALFKGAVTTDGYHYVFVSSTTLPTIRRAKSSFDNDLSVATAWATSTIVGNVLASANVGIIGVSDNTLWVASTTTILIPFTISTTTNTLTAGSPLTISGATLALATSRVNRNGIYAAFGSAPFVRKYYFDGNPDYRKGSAFQAAPSTTGPEVFVMKNSLYRISGTAQCGKVYGW